MNDTRKFIESLELADQSPDINLSIFDAYESTSETPSYLNFKALNSFSKGVSDQTQEDVLNSLLLAQRAASKKFPDNEQIKDWYEMYFHVLQELGYVVTNRDWNTLGEKSHALEIDKAIFELLSGLLTVPQINVLTRSLDMLKSLGSDDKRLIAFESNTAKHNRGNFQLGSAEESNGNVSIIGSGFILESEKQMKKILFLKFDKNVVNIKLDFFRAELATSEYSKNREAVKKKLGNSHDFIASLDI